MTKQTHIENSQVIAGSLVIIATVCVTVALNYTSQIMIPLVLAIFLYYLIAPMIEWLQDRGRFPRWLAIISSLTLIGIVLAVIIPFLGQSIVTFIGSAESYKDRSINIILSINEFIKHYNINLGQEAIIETMKNLPIFDWASSIVGNAASILTTSFLVLVFLFFILIGEKSTAEKKGIWLKIDFKIRRYLATKIVTSALTGILVGVFLKILGLELAIVFGVFAFFLNFIPTIGSIISTLLPLPIALLQFTSPLAITAVFVGPLTFQILIGNIIEPLIMGDHLELHPVTLLCALIFWGLIWGVTGMLLAAPITAILKIVCDRFKATEPIGDLLEGHLPSFATTKK